MPTSIKHATATTIGITRKPYLENSENEIECPLLERIFAHISPASAPVSIKLAPRLLPTTSANIEPSLAARGAEKDELCRVLTKKIVTGWLFIKPAASDDK
ncbi:MAG: hypothetical protein QXQ50_01640 [Candidatus Bathyarchaeia archaeon]